MKLAADTSSLIALLQGQTGPDTTLLDALLPSGQVVLPPIVLAELLSSRSASGLSPHWLSLELIELGDGYWERTGLLRRTILSKGLKSHTADALIAQACIDADIALITRDADFRHYAKHGGLKLA